MTAITNETVTMNNDEFSVYTEARRPRKRRVFTEEQSLFIFPRHLPPIPLPDRFPLLLCA